MRPFFIIGFPRSRTAWLANYFWHGGRKCYHELYPKVPLSMHHSWLNDKDGDSNSSLLYVPQYVINCAIRYEVNILSIYRNEEESFTSLKKAFHKENLSAMDIIRDSGMLQENFWQIHHILFGKRNFMPINFNDIDEKLPQIHEFLTPEIPFDVSRAELLKHTNVQQMIKKTLDDTYRHPSEPFQRTNVGPDREPSGEADDQ